MLECSEARMDKHDVEVDQAIESIDLRELYKMFWRRKIAILATLVCGISVALIMIAIITPRYVAQSSMVFQSESSKSSLQNYILPFSTGGVNSAYLVTEVEILKSKKLILEVISKLQLVGEESHNDVMAFKDISLKSEQGISLAPEKLDRNTAALVEHYQKSLKVSAVPGSTIINLNFSSSDAYLAALFINTLTDTYREMKLAEKYEVRNKLISWLENRISEVQDQVIEIETAIEKFKTDNEISQGKRDLVSYENLGDLNARLVNQQAELGDLKSQLQSFDKNSSYDIVAGSYSKNINVASLKSLQAEKRMIENELAQLSNRYGPKHPEIIDRKTQIKELDKALSQEVKLSKRALKSEVELAETKLEEINEQIKEAGQKFQGDSTSMVKLRELEREAEASRMVLATLMQTYNKSIGQNDTLESLGINVLSYANVPYTPAYPNKPLLFSLAVFISLSLGLIIAILIEKLDNVFRRPTQLERIFNVPCHVSIPQVGNMDDREMANYILSQPSSAVAEAIRTLRISLSLEPVSGEGKARSILVTSSYIDEGKTALSVWLGRLSAKAGEKVILIDANLRNPKLHKLLGQANDTSLVDFLSGQKKLEETVKKDDASGMDYICGQAVPNTAFDLINAKKLEVLIEALRQKYDMIIINAPPSYEMPDAKAMSRLADQTLYLVAANKTPRDFVDEGVRYFIEKGQSGFAFVMSNVK
ncbi:MAG: polysaccharide biosynthesis tyrosine autokinase [Micavibrio sp.]|nr:polysaccharide biosynthesis tyrosine autokinase [Micavibrio sp.]